MRKIGKERHYTEGRVASSKLDSHCIACSRDSPHISAEGCSPPQKRGRSGLPNTLQRNASSNWIHGTPAGLPFGMPGRGEVMEGAMQQAAQPSRQRNWDSGELTDEAYRIDEAVTLNWAGQVKELRSFPELE